MFSKIKKAADRQNAIDLLKFIVAGTMSPHGYAFVPPALYMTAAKAEPSLTELVTNIPAEVGTGNVAVKATQAGLDAVSGGAASYPATPNAPANQSTATSPNAAVSQYAIEDGVAVPPLVRGFGAGNAGRGESYPFSQLNVGQSFFVPKTDTDPTPWKRMASVSSGATRRFANDTGTTKAGRKPGTTVKVWSNTRVFTTRRMTNEAGVEGARVFRTQ